MATKIEVLKATILSLGGSFDDIDATDEAALSKRLIEVCGKLQNPGGGSGGSGLPTGGEPYQQLVTDGEGNAVWEERLAYEDISAVVIPETTLTPSEEMGNMGIVFDAPLTPPVSGETYLITYNGTPYLCTAYGMDDDGDGVDELVFIGNMGLMGGDDTGEPFVGTMLADLEAGAAEGYYAGFMHSGGLEPFTLSMAQATIKKVDSKFIGLSDHYTKAKTDELLSAYLPKAEYEAERDKAYEEITTIDMNGVADTGEIDLNGVYEKIWLNIYVESPQETVNLKVSLFNGDGTPAMAGTLWNMLSSSSTEKRIDAFMYVDGGLAGVTEASARSDSNYLTPLQRYICGLGGAYTYKGFGGLQVVTLSGNPVSATSATIHVRGIKA